MSYVSDYIIDSVIHKKFTTVDTTGVAVGLCISPILGIYKNSTTSKTIVGITTIVSFDSITGLNHVQIDLSQNTSFFSAGSDFQAVILAGTLTSLTSVNGYELFDFSVENRPLPSSERNAIADAFLDRNMATGTDSGSTTVRTPRQAFRFLRNKWTILTGTLSVKKEDDSTESWSATVGSTTTGDPIISLDPAGP